MVYEKKKKKRTIVDTIEEKKIKKKVIHKYLVVWMDTKGSPMVQGQLFVGDKCWQLL